MKSVKCGVEFDRCPAIYQPGEKVEACVTLQLRYSTKLSEISVRILGKSTTEYTEKQKNSEGKLVKIPYNQEEIHFDATVNLSGYVQKYSDWKLRSGDHRLPFDFCLPVKIPPSFKAKAAEISYVCQLNIVGVKQTNSQTVIVPFQVCCPPESPDYFTPQEISDSQELISCFRRFGSIEVRVAIEKGNFIRGEEIYVSLMINNRSTKSVGILRSSLIAMAVYKGTRPNGTKWEVKEKPKILAQKNCAGQLGPGDIFNLPSLPALIVPKDLAQLTVDNCSTIKFSYTLRVRIADRFNFDLPVFISL